MQTQILKDIIIEVLKSYNPQKIGIFGSYARGQENPGSDIDILVKFRKPLSFFELVRLENELSDKLGVRADLVTEGALTNSYIRNSVESEIEIILES